MGIKLHLLQLSHAGYNLFNQEMGSMRFPGTVAGLHPFCYALAIACLASCGASQPALASEATVTTLLLTAGGNPASSVAGGTVVTLTASVQAGTTAQLVTVHRAALGQRAQHEQAGGIHPSSKSRALKYEYSRAAFAARAPPAGIRTADH